MKKNDQISLTMKVIVSAGRLFYYGYFYSWEFNSLGNS